MKVAHLTTVDMSLRFLVFPQLQAVVGEGGESLGISAPGPWVEELRAAGIRHLPLPSSTRGMDVAADLRAARDLWRVLRAERPDVLHTHNPKPGLYGRILGRLVGVPIVVNTVHGLYATEDDPFFRRLLIYLLEAAAARFSDAELVQNPEDLALMLRFRISPRSRTRLLGNGVDLARFDPALWDDGHREEVRQELGVGPGQILVAMVGRLVTEKGYPELFEAAAHLDDRYVVVCVGPHDPEKADALEEGLIEEARRTGVRFLGMRDDIERLYQAMDLFVLPSHREGFPRAAMEAAAMGLPIVATDIRGCREVVEHGVNGLLVPVRDPSALAEAVRRIGEDAELRLRMGEAGRQRALDHFDERAVVRLVMDTYREVARRKGLGHLLRSSGDGAIEVRMARSEDASALALLHAQSIDTGFLPQLGVRFLRRLYRALIAWPQAVVLVADGGEGPLGFVAGVEDTGRFYRHFAGRHGIPAGLAALPRLLHPSNVRRAWETLRYQGGGIDVPGELLSMAVAPSLRGRGLGMRLGGELLEALRARGAPSVKVVVGKDNEVALRAYRNMGFRDAGTVHVHGEEASVLLVWSG